MGNNRERSTVGLLGHLGLLHIVHSPLGPIRMMFHHLVSPLVFRRRVEMPKAVKEKDEKILLVWNDPKLTQKQMLPRQGLSIKSSSLL